MNFPFDLFFLDAGRLDGKIVATGLPSRSVAPSDPTATPIPSSSPEAPSVGPTPQPGVTTIEGEGLDLHWRAAATVENGKACIYLTIDDIPKSEQACGDASRSGAWRSMRCRRGHAFLFGLVPEMIDLDWEIDGERVVGSGSLMWHRAVEHDAASPSSSPSLQRTGDLTLRFMGRTVEQRSRTGRQLGGRAPIP